MRRLLAGSLIALLCAGSASAGTTPPPGGGPEPSASLEHFDCHQASVALNRAISITAVMRAKSGFTKLELQFELERKVHHDHRFIDIREGDLGTWLSPKDSTLGERSADVWNVNKQVVNLAAPGVYRFAVHFRWVGDHGTSDTTLFSQRCFQAR